MLVDTMATNESLASSLNYMTDAAHLLAKAAPETSAHIMSQRNSFMFHNNLEQPDAHRQNICGSCGHITIPGGGSPIRLETERTSRRKRSGKVDTRAKPSAPKKHKILTCQNCDRYTKISIPAPPSVSHNRTAFKQRTRHLAGEVKGGPTPVNPAVARAPASLPESSKVSLNANSKKRAKNRKQGLLALLQQSQASTPKTGLGLSLADFMKK